MSALTALLTPRGPGAIATVKLSGPSANRILSAVFRPSSAIPSLGNIAVGRIVDDHETIDQVVLACESKDSFAINSHGSPLIVELVMDLLRRHGATPVEPKVFLYHELRRDPSLNSIAIEASLAQLDCLTLEGTKLVAAQLTTGLAPLAAGWLANISPKTLPSVKSAAAEVLSRASTARLITHGVRIVLAGPPNSGKSTLLNCLAGRATSIVTDTPGTTRDYVSAHLTVPSLALEVIDTAGLDDSLVANGVDMAAQKKTRDLLASADLVLLVLDSTCPAARFDTSLLASRKTLTVVNKSDLAPAAVPGAISISAVSGENIGALISAIRAKLGVDTFDLAAAVCFTPRQQDILSRIATATDPVAAGTLITELLNGPLTV